MNRSRFSTQVAKSGGSFQHLGHRLYANAFGKACQPDLDRCAEIFVEIVLFIDFGRDGGCSPGKDDAFIRLDGNRSGGPQSDRAGKPSGAYSNHRLAVDPRLVRSGRERLRGKLRRIQGGRRQRHGDSFRQRLRRAHGFADGGQPIDPLFGHQNQRRRADHSGTDRSRTGFLRANRYGLAARPDFGCQGRFGIRLNNLGQIVAIGIGAWRRGRLPKVARCGPVGLGRRDRGFKWATESIRRRFSSSAMTSSAWRRSRATSSLSSGAASILVAFGSARPSSSSSSG